MREPILSRRLFSGAAAATLAMGPWAASAAQKAGEPLPLRAIGRPFPGGVTLPDTAPAASAEGSVGIAVIGLGYYALAQMMPAFGRSQRTHVAAVVSGNPEKARRVAKAYGLPKDAIYSYADFAKIARDDRVEAVFIALPSGLHADWTEKSFAAGKHVLCEKPMAVSAEECQRMIDAGKRADRRLMIAYRCHFEPYNIRAMELMRDGAVGPVRTIVTANHYRVGNDTPADNWRLVRSLTGGGALEDYGLYGLQASLYLSGEMPSHVSAQTIDMPNDPRFTQIPAGVNAQLGFPSGASAQISTSYDAAGANYVSVRGQEGFLEMDPATSYGGIRMSIKKGREVEEFEPGDTSTQFAKMADHFADAIRDGTPILTPGEMGLRDLRLIEAIYAAAERRTVIALNPDGTMKG